MLGGVGPYGSYPTVITWLEDQATLLLQCPPDGNLITFFDNNQIIGKSWNINHDNLFKKSVITMQLHIQTNGEEITPIQTMTEHRPSEWLTDTSLEAAVWRDLVVKNDLIFR